MGVEPYRHALITQYLSMRYGTVIQFSDSISVSLETDSVDRKNYTSVSLRARALQVFGCHEGA